MKGIYKKNPKYSFPYHSGVCATCRHRFILEEDQSERCHCHVRRTQFAKCEQVPTCSDYFEIKT